MNTEKIAERIDEGMRMEFCALVGADGEPIEDGFVAPTSTEGELATPVGVPQLREWIEAHPVGDRQGYAIGYNDPDPGARIQVVDIRATWAEIEDITEPGNEIWSMGPDDPGVTIRK